MTIRLLAARGHYPVNAIVTLDAGTEAGLVAAKLAEFNLTGGTPYVAPTLPNQRFDAQIEVDPAGAVVGLVADGKVIAMGGGEQPSENTPAARAVKTIAAVTQTQLITSNSSAATGQRLACAEKNRKRIVFKNPASNTVSIQIGQTQNDNINRNGSYTTSYTIAPGEELVCWYDQNQWYARQASATAVANQSLIVESEVNV